MTKFNKKTAVLLAVFVVLCMFVFVSCEDKNQNKALTGTATIVVGEKEYSIDLAEAQMYSNNTVFDAMEYLAQKDANDSTKAEADKFTYTGTISSYGAFVSTISGITLADRQYIALFVSDIQYKDTSAYCLDNKTINGTIYYYSGVGVSSIKLADGLKVLFIAESY